MTSIKEDACAFIADLGPAWVVSSAAVLALSLLFRTWFLVGAVFGTFLTLYIHPFESKLGGRPHAYSSSSSSSSIPDSNLHDREKTAGLLTTIPQRLRAELEVFSEKMIRDYVRWWYRGPNFPADDTFPSECQSSLNFVLNGLYLAITRKDPILYFDAIFTSSVATIGVVLEDLREAYKLKSDSDPIGLFKFTMLYPESPLARMTSKSERKNNMQRRTDDLIKSFARKADAQCGPAYMLMRQVLAESVFENALKNLANKDSLNALIISTLKDQSTDQASQMDSAKTRMAAALTGATQAISENTDARGSEIGCMLSDEMIDTNPPIDEMSSAPADSIEALCLGTRGRRLSFKNHSISSISDFGPADDSTAERRSSFLKRTGSLLTKSRSRSTSPSKDIRSKENTPSPERHSRSRSISPFKRASKSIVHAGSEASYAGPQEATLFYAELIVNDISEIPQNKFNQTISKTALPKFSILISPVKQEGYGSSAGIGIFRSILDINELDLKLRAAAIPSSPRGAVKELYLLPEWRQLTYAQLENEVLAYLTSVTRLRPLAELEAFSEFCRSDIVSQDRQDDRTESWAFAEGGKALLGTLRKGTDFVRPSLVFTPKKDPVKRSSLDEGIRTPNQKNVVKEPKAIMTEMHESESKESYTPRNLSNLSPGSKITDTSRTSGVDLNRIDFQNLVSQSMEILTVFFSLSSRTWTIRKQLLNLLRNLLLSKNSIYSQTFLTWLDNAVFLPISSPDTVADLLHQINSFMFPEAYIKPEPLTKQQSACLALEARALFIQKSMPSAIRNLMGVGPTNESLTILFDALQEEEFSLGLVSILFSEAFKMFLVE